MPIKTKTKKLGDYLEKLSGKPELSIESLPSLNRMLFGLERKKLVVIGARPSEGKSSFCVYLAYELSKTYKVLFLSLEMTEEEAMFRLFCHAQRISNLDLYTGMKLSYSGKLEQFKKDIQERRLIITEERGKNWKEVDGIMETFLEDKPDIIFLDYLQYIQGQGTQKKMIAIEEYIKNFRELAIANNICVVLASQISRANIADNKEPTMEGLKGTGEIEQVADKVILLHYPCKHNHDRNINDFKIIVAKNKNGMTGYVNVKFLPSIYTFEEPDGENLTDLKDKMEDKVVWKE